MAFCTSCGAEVKGAFCQQCGTPAGASTAAATPPPVYRAPVIAAGAKPKTSPLVWILVAVLGLFVLVFLCVLGVGMYVARNPGLVIGKLITAANPNAEIVSTDMGSQTIRVRDKKTGEEVTVSFDDVKNGRFKMSAVGRNGEMANLEIGGGAGKTPSWVPIYPGGTAKGNFTARGDDGSSRGAGGVVSFATPDAPSKVLEFYKDKIDGLGMKVVTSASTDESGTIVAHTDDDQRTLHVTVAKGSGETTIGLTFGEKR